MPLGPGWKSGRRGLNKLSRHRFCCREFATLSEAFPAQFERPEPTCFSLTSDAMPRVCSGLALEDGAAAMRCIFAAKKSGQRSHAGPSRKCLFCDPRALPAACRTEKGQNRAVQLLRAFRKVYEDKPHIYNSAMMRVPEELREDLHARALARARPPARVPRGKSAADSAAAAAAAWDAQLASQKRALRPLGKKKWTAYKKRRTADRSRVVKKSYVDQGLPPPPSEVARDVAENDCGLPALESGERAWGLVNLLLRGNPLSWVQLTVRPPSVPNKPWSRGALLMYC